MFLRLTACFVFLTFVSTASGAPVESTAVNSVPDTPDCSDEKQTQYDFKYRRLEVYLPTTIMRNNKSNCQQTEHPNSHYKLPSKQAKLELMQREQEVGNENSDFYDQRQNGTENYRIHVNGVVVLVAPAEAVLQAAQLGSLQISPESESSTLTSQPLKPKPKPPTVTDKIPNSHDAQTSALRPKHIKDKNNVKLLNLLHMFRSMRHDSEEQTHHLNK